VRDGASRGGFLAEIIMAHIHAFARVRECAREFGESSGVPLVVESPLWALERQKLPWPTSARMSSSCREKFCGKVRQALPRAFRVCLSFSFSLSLCLSLSLSLSAIQTIAREDVYRDGKWELLCSPRGNRSQYGISKKPHLKHEIPSTVLRYNMPNQFA